MEANFPVIDEEALEFTDRLGGNDEIPLVPRRVFYLAKLRIAEGKTATIRGDKGCLGAIGGEAGWGRRRSGSLHSPPLRGPTLSCS